MQRIYKGRYYDGLSSRAYTVDVTYGSDHLHIYYVDEEGITHNLDWPKHEIRELQYSSSVISLKHDASPLSKQLDMTDPDFIREYARHFKVSWYYRLVNSGKRNIALYIFVALITLIPVTYFFLLPLFADLFSRTFPKEYEISLGEKLYASVLESEETDSAKTAAINRFFHQMKIEGDYPVRITVVQKNIANAFSLPGGGIVVYDRILDHMNSYDELAALLAHEYSHIQLKHPTRNIFRTLSGYLFVSMLLGDISGISAVILQNAEGLRSLQYSRSLEHEADENGLMILKENHIDAAGMEKLFQQLKQDEKIAPPELLNSHPDLDSRIEFAKTFREENPYRPSRNDSMEWYFREVVR